MRTGTNVICIVELPAWQIGRAQLNLRLRFLTTSDWAEPMPVPGVWKYWDKVLYCRLLVDESLVASLKDNVRRADLVVIDGTTLLVS